MTPSITTFAMILLCSIIMMSAAAPTRGSTSEVAANTSVSNIEPTLTWTVTERTEEGFNASIKLNNVSLANKGTGGGSSWPVTQVYFSNKVPFPVGEEKANIDFMLVAYFEDLLGSLTFQMLPYMEDWEEGKDWPDYEINGSITLPNLIDQTRNITHKITHLRFKPVGHEIPTPLLRFPNYDHILDPTKGWIHQDKDEVNLKIHLLFTL